MLCHRRRVTARMEFGIGLLSQRRKDAKFGILIFLHLAPLRLGERFSEEYFFAPFAFFAAISIRFPEHLPALRRQLDDRLLSHVQLRVAGELGEQRYAAHFHFQ